MTIPAGTGNWCSKRKFGFISLALSLTEVLVIYGAVAWIVVSEQQHTPGPVRNLVDFAFLLGGLSSLGVAVAGLMLDSNRLPALIAVFTALLTFMVCGLQMLV